MKQLLLFLAGAALLLKLAAQPLMTNGVIALNFDGVGNIEAAYNFGGSGGGNGIVIWDVGGTINPWGQTRILRATAQRTHYLVGEEINASQIEYKKTIPDDPRPPIVVYSLVLLNYRAISEDDGASWEYSTLTPAFENQSEVFLGLKLALGTGTHYGWLRMTRPVVDEHTLFEIAGHAYHPVPGEPIPAGELPALPPLQTVVDAEGFTFSWDPRWGELVLETATSLAPPVSWEPVVQSAGGPVTMAVEDEAQRFYRLRQP